ncbi:TetR/AcrR family transcriptional regulator [Georgenia subflava]|uniref:TetR family transcriptional regulator n=1 Tax=Georgenia subflava TaxID=1622177 RepID=A0A6N7ECA0_9MICO|nr:TetR/AcrR family transcriptional regulator [Georgenia subflava]MPV35600.1 TetR family transcriptional regulator [Georgenia subflava]
MTTLEHPVRAAADPRGPGRPRAVGHDGRIVDAAIELLERGEEITVRRVVELSGVSRAAIYRRWPSMTDLVAAALDQGREPYDIPLEGDLLENVLAAFTSSTQTTGATYPEGRFRLRLRLAMTDRKLAQAYWRSHVARRRAGLVALLRAGIDRGELRDDLDLDACIDLMTGVFYYQFVVRGVSFEDPDAMARCADAIRVAWRGMSTS